MSARKPNIVYIFADEWRAQATGYAGDSNCHTPVLDHLASESVNFRNAVSGCSVCCPARASLMTGQYPLRHGVIINDVELDPTVDSIARILGRSGYETGYIGKWHLYGSPDGAFGRRNAFVPRDHQLGFDYWKAFECSHDYNESYYFFNDDPKRRKWDGYDAFAQARDAASFITNRAGSQTPYLLMLSWGPPHFPLHTAPEEYRQRYQGRAIALRENVPAELRETAQEELRGYYAHIAALDDALQTVLSALDASGDGDNTILIVTSDHGDMRQSQGLATKLFPFDESIRVPFLLRWPQALGRHGRTIDVPIDIPDHLPTLLGLVGADIPGQVQGTDWSPLIRGETQPTGDEAAFLSITAEFTEILENGMQAYRGLRTDRYTYVRNVEGPWLLYDNVKDPYQKRNLIGSADYSYVANDLERRLRERLAALKDDFQAGSAYLERAGLTHYQEVTRNAKRIWTDPWGQPPVSGR